MLKNLGLLSFVTKFHLRGKTQTAKRKCWIKLWIRRRVRCMLYTHKGVADRGCSTSSQFRSYERNAVSIYRVVE
nr:unnamed protein product [Callosobruchus analis]